MLALTSSEARGKVCEQIKICAKHAKLIGRQGEAARLARVSFTVWGKAVPERAHLPCIYSLITLH